MSAMPNSYLSYSSYPIPETFPMHSLMYVFPGNKVTKVTKVTLGTEEGEL